MGFVIGVTERSQVHPETGPAAPTGAENPRTEMHTYTAAYAGRAEHLRWISQAELAAAVAAASPAHPMFHRIHQVAAWLRPVGARVARVRPATSPVGAAVEAATVPATAVGW